MKNDFKLKEVSLFTGTPIRRIHYLREHGIINPRPKNKSVGRGSILIYSLQDLMRTKVGSEMIESGITISKIKQVLMDYKYEPNTIKVIDEHRFQLSPLVEIVINLQPIIWQMIGNGIKNDI